MTAAGVVTIIAALLTIVVLAAYLIFVALTLRRVTTRLDAINAGVVAITDKTGPLAPVINGINQDLAGVDDTLHTVLTRERAPRHAAPEAAPAAPPPPRSQSQSPDPWVVAPQARHRLGNE